MVYSTIYRVASFMTGVFNGNYKEASLDVAKPRNGTKNEETYQSLEVAQDSKDGKPRTRDASPLKTLLPRLEGSIWGLRIRTAKARETSSR